MSLLKQKVKGKKRKLLYKALNLAEASHYPGRFSLCAIIVRKNKILTIGYNSKKTHPKATSKSKFIHAEMEAIFIAQRKRINLRGADIYVARYRVIGSGIALPCKKCYSMIKEEGISNIYYTESDSLFSCNMISL